MAKIIISSTIITTKISMFDIFMTKFIIYQFKDVIILWINLSFVNQAKILDFVVNCTWWICSTTFLETRIKNA